MRIGLVLVAGLLASWSPALAQGLTSGTGMQPSQTLATPPGTPAIDRPGAERAAAKASAARISAARRHAAPVRPPGSR